jgi:hypothetical protein
MTATRDRNHSGVPVPSDEWLYQRQDRAGAFASGDMKDAAVWGADEQLNRCIVWLSTHGDSFALELAQEMQRDMRPKPPSLKQQAMEALDHILNNSSSELGASTIRRALEALPDD